MDNNILTIQERLMSQLDRLSDATGDEIINEVARSNSIAQISNTFIKACNLLIRVDEVAEKTHVSASQLNKSLGITHEK